MMNSAMPLARRSRRERRTDAFFAMLLSPVACRECDRRVPRVLWQIRYRQPTHDRRASVTGRATDATGTVGQGACALHAPCVTPSPSSVAPGRNRGGRRCFVACSYAYAIVSSVGSLYAEPKKEIPTGRPKV